MTVTAEPQTKPGPPSALTNPDTGHRWYIHPTTGERFISVTTVLSHIAKYGLTDWAARLAAQAAFDNLPLLNRASRHPLCNSTRTDDACGNCRDCVTYWLADRHNQERDAAAERGTKLHDAAEQTILHGPGAHVDDDAKPLVDQWYRWYERYRPEFLATEITVISRKWGYGGTLDAILRFTEQSRLPKQLAHLTGLPLVDDYKGLALDTLIPTPSGWTTMRHIEVGEELFDAHGKVCRVTGKSEVRLVDCYRLKFDDGTEIVCDADHKWPVISGNPAQRVGVLDTRTIASTLFERGQRQHRVAVAGSMDLPDVALPIEPYTLGCWLGDGTAAGGGVTKPDDELYELITAASGLQCAPPAAGRECPTRTVYGLRRQLRLAGLLNNKHVPTVYLRASARQRLALLQGLMDTDGSMPIQKRHQVVFVSTDKAMAHAVRELALSLGERAIIDERPQVGYGRTVTSYRVSWRPTKHNPFRLTRKAKLVDSLGSAGRSGRRLVVSAERTITVPTQCIAVDSPDHTYLCGEQMIPTHNSSRNVYLTNGWQVGAYANADAVLLPDGTEQPMPEIKGGLIVHIRPERVQMREAYLTDANFAYFVHMCRVVEGLAAPLNSVLSRPVTMKEGD